MFLPSLNQTGRCLLPTISIPLLFFFSHSSSINNFRPLLPFISDPSPLPSPLFLTLLLFLPRARSLPSLTGVSLHCLVGKWERHRGGIPSREREGEGGHSEREGKHTVGIWRLRLSCSCFVHSINLLIVVPLVIPSFDPSLNPSISIHFRMSTSIPSDPPAELSLPPFTRLLHSDFYLPLLFYFSLFRLAALFVQTFLWQGYQGFKPVISDFHMADSLSISDHLSFWANDLTETILIELSSLYSP